MIIKNLLSIVFFPLLMLLTGCPSGNSSSGSGVQLERIDIVASPITTRGVSELTLAKGNQQPFEAIGYYSDGSSSPLTDLNVSNWHASNPGVGRFDRPGIFTAVDVGNTTLTATKDGVVSNVVDVNVTAAVVTGITVDKMQIDINIYIPGKIEATAHLSDGQDIVVTDTAVWSSNNINIQASKGVISATQYPDSGNVTVSYGGYSVEVAVRVVEAQTSGVIGTATSYEKVISFSEHSNLSFKGSAVVDGIYDADSLLLLAGGTGGSSTGDFSDVLHVSSSISKISGYSGNSWQAGLYLLERLEWTENGADYHVGSRTTGTITTVNITQEPFGLKVYQSQPNGGYISGIEIIYK